jgi:hypothetical protein
VSRSLFGKRKGSIVLVISPIQVIILLIIFGGYLAPAIIAFARHHHNRVAITVLNVLAGWTFFGWIAALVWSLTNPSPGSVATSPALDTRAGAQQPKFDSVTGRPIVGYDPQTGEPVLGEREA